ncbi:MAG: aconitase family protein, partial [Gemmatimonadales bacterium]|nr:aconitase family protein [Gemmatimonadales bacterium]
ITPEAAKEAYQAIEQARARAGSATDRERAYIEALAKRYAPDPAAERAPLDRAYADAMRVVAQRFPDDLDASTLKPMVALPGDPGNGLYVEELGGPVKIDIAYAGSCTAGKREDMDMYARVFREAVERGVRVAPWIQCYIQCGSQDVFRYCRERGYDQVFREVGATFIEPSCGACINAGPGVSRHKTDVTISAINRNFPGRSGPGQLYLASPYTVAASALTGYITVWESERATAPV